MKILHITPHLGGGVGKAHGALCAATSRDIQRHYILLEAPRDVRFMDSMRASDAHITIAPDFATIAQLVSEADIVQVEWWNHPRIYECLCRANLPPMRTVFWSHVSGLHAPFIPTGLFAAADCFLLTSSCSLEAPNIATLPETERRRIEVAGSAVGFENSETTAPSANRPPPVAYLGTVDFAKMSPDTFEVIDAVDAPEFTVSIWGAVDPAGEVAHRRAAMRAPERVDFKGHSIDPRSILAEAGIFLYLLQPHHFGTAENALIEAMSLGWAPLVFANPAETAIVRHGETGFIEKDAAAACRRLAWMMRNPDAVARVGRQAATEIAATRTPQAIAGTFDRVYRSVLAREKRQIDFSSILGHAASDWFLSTQLLDTGTPHTVDISTGGTASKGSFSHFLHCFPEDPSLHALLRTPGRHAMSQKTA